MAKSRSSKQATAKSPSDPHLRRTGPGRPTKMDASAKAAAVEILKAGGSRANAAAFIGIDYSNFHRAVQADPEFAAACHDAEGVGELNLVLKLRDLAGKEFPALKFMLERKYWQTWGRKDPRDISPDQFASIIAQIMAVVVMVVPGEYHPKINEGISNILRGLERMNSDGSQPANTH